MSHAVEKLTERINVFRDQRKPGVKDENLEWLIADLERERARVIELEDSLAANPTGHTNSGCGDEDCEICV